MNEWFVVAFLDDGGCTASIESNDWIRDNRKYLHANPSQFDVAADTPTVIKWRNTRSSKWVFYIKLDELE